MFWYMMKMVTRLNPDWLILLSFLLWLHHFPCTKIRLSLWPLLRMRRGQWSNSNNWKMRSITHVSFISCLYAYCAMLICAYYKYLCVCLCDNQLCCVDGCATSFLWEHDSVITLFFSISTLTLLLLFRCISNALSLNSYHRSIWFVCTVDFELSINIYVCLQCVRMH